MPARPVPDPDPADDEIYDAELLPDEPDPAAPTADPVEFAFLFGDADPPPAPPDIPGEVFAAPPPSLPVFPTRDPHEGPTVVEGVPVDAGVLDAEVVPSGRPAGGPTTVTKPARGRRPAVKITFLRPGQPSPLGPP